MSSERLDAGPDGRPRADSLDRFVKDLGVAGVPWCLLTCHGGGYTATVGASGAGPEPHATPLAALRSAYRVEVATTRDLP